MSVMRWMEDYIKFLLTTVSKDKLGIGLDDLKYSFNIVSKKKAKLYYLKFVIPYAKQFITLEMYFNPLYPELGPDLILNEEDDNQQAGINDFINDLTSLASWSPTNELSMLEILLEFIEVYKKHQLSVLKANPDAIRFDPEVLFSTIPLKNFEINLIQGTKQMEAKFLTKFELDLSSALNLVESKVVEALLFISFGGTSYNRVVPELYLPGFLTKLFDGSESLHIPPFVEVQHVADYIEKVKECVIEKAQTVFSSTDRRKQFIATLLAVQPGTILEYDVINYRKATLLLELQDVHFLLNFDLPSNFPIKQFTMTMHSVHHMTDQGKPIVKIVNNFPYSPRWDPKQMILKAVSHIIDNEFKKFKDTSNKTLF